MPASGISTLERFFRAAASLDIDKNDVKRYQEFVGDKLVDLLIMGEATAKANDRDIVEPWDLPITKGLQESVHRFEKMEEAVELEPILERLAGWPQLDRPPSEETQQRFPELIGGMSLALAHAFTIIDPKLGNPQTAQWERAFRLFDLLL